MKEMEDKMSNTIRNSKGFTLVELAIVLVIIGIILGAVLKGQELINNAKSKRAYNQVREVSAAIYTYMDKYGLKLPGDDNSATTRWPTATNGNANGFIDSGGVIVGGQCATGDTGEGCQFWRHLKEANIITGALDSTNPRNPYGGWIGVGYHAAATLGGPDNLIGLSNIPNNVAYEIDLQYDDGVFNTGSIQTQAAYVPGSRAPISLYFRF